MPTSLISIVAAMVLVGLMALMAEPSLSATERTRHTSMLRQIEYLTELARLQSATTDTVHGVRWDESTRTFDVIQADVSSFPAAILGTAVDPASKQPARLVLPEDTVLLPDRPFEFEALAAQDTLFFDGWGTPFNVNASAQHVQLANAQLDITAETWSGWVLIRPLTGRVSSSEP
jgi:hypothetical protein